MLSKPIPMRPELAAALERAVAAYKAMTPEQRREMHSMMLDHPEMSREYVENIYDRVV